MSTNSSITIKINDKFETIYCHFDGYTEGVGQVLKNHYNKKEKAQALINLGDLSFLDIKLEPEPGITHTWEERAEGVTMAYGRDRNEEGVEKRTYDTLEEVYLHEKQEFNYYFDDNEEEWYVLTKDHYRKIQKNQF